MRARWRPLTSAARPRRSVMVRATTSAHCGSSSAITARATTRAPAYSRRTCFATCSRRHAPSSAIDRQDPALALIAGTHVFAVSTVESWMPACRDQLTNRDRGRDSTVLLIAQPGDHLHGVLVRREYRIERLTDDAVVDN